MRLKSAAEAVAVEELVANLRVVVGVREVDPQRLVLLVPGGQVGVREEVEEVELSVVDKPHGLTPV